LQGFYSIGLGTEAVNPLEMARAYATFANGGRRIDTSFPRRPNQPRAIVEITDHEGEPILVNRPRGHRVLTPGQAARVTSILEKVVSQGTGTRAQLDDRPAAGKTGTTENYGDAWFVGYTPQLAVAVWVGYPNKLIPMETEFKGDPVAGGTFPALIWRTFARTALSHLGEPPAGFPSPSYESVEPRRVVYRNNRWLVDNGNCRDSREVLFFSGSGPDALASCKPNEVDVPNVVGARLSLAESRLLSMPLTPEVIWRPARPGERLGLVTEQIPARGTLSSWSTVRVVLPRSPNGRVPDVVGLTLDEARGRLARRRLAGAVRAYADGEPEGVVLAQFPRAGRAAVRNMTVRLVVSRG
jgi:membrane peptidoglycan carboxypeptidase